VTQTLSSRLGSVTLKNPSWSPMLNTLTSNEAGHLRVMGRNIRFLKSDLETFRASFKQEMENA
jgi:hypothetical protein